MWVIYTLISIILIIFIVLFVFPITVQINDNIVPTFNKIKKYKRKTLYKI